MAQKKLDTAIDDPHAEIEGYLASEAWETRLADARARRESVLAARRSNEQGERPSIRPTASVVQAATAQPDEEMPADPASEPEHRFRRMAGIGAVLLAGIAAGAMVTAIALGGLTFGDRTAELPMVEPAAPALPEVTAEAPAFPEEPPAASARSTPASPAGEPSAVPSAPTAPAEAAPPVEASRLGPPPPRPDRGTVTPPTAPSFQAAPELSPDVASSPRSVSRGAPQATRSPVRPERSAAARPSEADTPRLAAPLSLPGAEAYRITLHGQSSEARQTMEAQLVEAGFGAIELSETPFSWPATTVFFFHDEDASMAGRLAEHLDGTSRGVIGLAPSPPVGRLDVFLGN